MWQLNINDLFEEIPEQKGRKKNTLAERQEKNNDILKVGYYARMKNGDVYRIDGIAAPKKIYRYTKKRAYQGRIFYEKQYDLERTFFSHIISENRKVKVVLDVEDVLFQRRRMIDCVREKDYIYTRSYGVLAVLQVFPGKVKKQEYFRNGKRVFEHRSTTCLQGYGVKNCYKIDEQELLGVVRSQKNMMRCVEEGDRVFDRWHGWGVVKRKLHSFLFCENEKGGYIVYPSQIKNYRSCEEE